MVQRRADERKTLERDIQKWLVEKVDDRERFDVEGLQSILTFGEGAEGEKSREYFTRSTRSSFEAAREVLRGLEHTQFHTADTRIVDCDNEILRPDIVLRDENTGAFLIIEIKRSASAARQGVSELLAYANKLRAANQGARVLLVLISTSWITLERHAIAGLAREIPTLPLEYVEAESGCSSPRLKVRSDLLPLDLGERFAPGALNAYSAAYDIKQLRFAASRDPILHSQLTHFISTLTRRAERLGMSGFIVAWLARSVLARRGQEPVRLFVTMVVRDATVLPVWPGSADIHDELDFAWSSRASEIVDGTAHQFLYGENFSHAIEQVECSSNGTWTDVAEWLEREEASLVSFEAFGSIGDEVARWRSQERHSLSGVVDDVTKWPSWHPMTWLPKLDALIDRGEDTQEAAGAWAAYDCGKSNASLDRPRPNRRVPRDFSWTAAQARFAASWHHFGARVNAPKLYPDIQSGFHEFSGRERLKAHQFATSDCEGLSALEGFCYQLGYADGSSQADCTKLLRQWAALRTAGVGLPSRMEMRLDNLRKRSTHFISSTVDF